MNEIFCTSQPKCGRVGVTISLNLHNSVINVTGCINLLVITAKNVNIDFITLVDNITTEDVKPRRF